MFPFPSAPYLGQLHITDSLLYRWNGINWDRLRIGTQNSSPQPTPTPTADELTLTALANRITAIEQQLETGLLLLE